MTDALTIAVNASHAWAYCKGVKATIDTGGLEIEIYGLFPLVTPIAK